jgi:hypothetical protein
MPITVYIKYQYRYRHNYHLKFKCTVGTGTGTQFLTSRLLFIVVKLSALFEFSLFHTCVDYFIVLSVNLGDTGTGIFRTQRRRRTVVVGKA